eukprot:s489_g1.t1
MDRFSQGHDRSCAWHALASVLSPTIHPESRLQDAGSLHLRAEQVVDVCLTLRWLTYCSHIPTAPRLEQLPGPPGIATA